MAIRAAVDSLGICLDSMLLAEQELRSGSLVVLFPETAMTVRGQRVRYPAFQGGRTSGEGFSDMVVRRVAADQGFVGGLSRSRGSPRPTRQGSDKAHSDARLNRRASISVRQAARLSLVDLAPSLGEVEPGGAVNLRKLP